MEMVKARELVLMAWVRRALAHDAQTKGVREGAIAASLKEGQTEKLEVETQKVSPM